MKVSVGDALEVLGALALVAGGFVWAGLVLALVLAGVALVYFGQVYQDVHVSPRLPQPRVPHRLVKTSVAPVTGPVFNCALCSGATPIGQQHRCDK